MAARDADKIYSAIFEHLLGKSRVLDIADSDDGNLHSLADVGGQIDLPPLCKIARLNDGRA